MRRGMLCVLGFSLCLASPVAAWQELVTRYCPTRGVPGVLALAVIATESRGQMYAIRVNARQPRALYPVAYTDAVGQLHTALQTTHNVDIGLMQINWRTWGTVLGIPPAALLDPSVNIRIGCRLLGLHMAQEGPLWQRIGRYHSRVPARQLLYVKRLHAAME